MDNKEIKTTTTELNDEALENVSGGLLVPCSEGIKLPGRYYSITCDMCKTVGPVRVDENYHSRLIGGLYYCDTCRPKVIASNTENVD